MPKANPDVTAMVRAYLIQHGYDGLYTEDCGCHVDDLAPCGDMPPTCQAGYRMATPWGEIIGNVRVSLDTEEQQTVSLITPYKPEPCMPRPYCSNPSCKKAAQWRFDDEERGFCSPTCRKTFQEKNSPC